MDNQCLILLSKFSVSARKVVGSVNPSKLLKDKLYSAEIFQKVDDMGDEELVLLSLELQNLLGLLKSPAEPDIPVLEKKYMFGARN